MERFATRCGILWQDVTASATDDIATELDVGTCQSGTLLISTDFTTDHVYGFEVWTSRHSSFASDGTQNVSDSGDTRMVTVTSDPDHLLAWTSSTNAPYYGLSVVSDNTISDITAAGADRLVAIHCNDLHRYLNVQWNAGGTGTEMTITFVGDEMTEAPYKAARTAY